MKLNFTAFQAALPRLDTTLLPENAAAKASNVYLKNRNLKPLAAPKPYKATTKPGDQLTIYRFAPIPGQHDSGFIFSWPKDVDVVKGPIAGNSQELTYWTGDGAPKFTDNSIATGQGELPKISYLLGVPDTNLSPQATVEDKPTDEADGETSDDEENEIDERLIERRDYVVTFTSTLGSLTMEGPPSNPSDIVAVSPHQQVKLTNIPHPPSGNYKWTGKNLYRRLVASGQESFALVAVLDANSDTFTDDLDTASIPGDALLSVNWYPPPENMHSLVALSNGLMFGANDNDICVSEPYLPHAWNPANRYPVPHKIVGLGVADNNVVAITEQNPYMLTGTTPAAMSTTELTLSQGCLSKRSIVSGNFGCCYASPDGLVLISSGGSRLLTEPVFTRKQWLAFNPSSMICAAHDDKIIIAYTDTSGKNGTMILMPRSIEQGVVFSDQYFTAARQDGLLDSLMVYTPGVGLGLWNEGAAMPYTWVSRQFILPEPATFTACRVEADSYTDLSVTLLTRSKVQKRLVHGREPFRFPDGYADHWLQVKIEGVDTVRRVILGECVSELQ